MAETTTRAVLTGFGATLTTLVIMGGPGILTGGASIAVGAVAAGVFYLADGAAESARRGDEMCSGGMMTGVGAGLLAAGYAGLTVFSEKVPVLAAAATAGVGLGVTVSGVRRMGGYTS